MKLKLTPAQAHVLQKMREGWDLVRDPFTGGYFISEEGHNNQERVSQLTGDSLVILELVKYDFAANGYGRYTLTPLGKSVELEGE